MRATSMILGVRPDPSKLDPAEYAVWVAVNRGALDVAHDALGRTCQTPADLLGALDGFRDRGNKAVLDVWFMLSNEATDAGFRGDSEALAKSGCALLKLGRAIPPHGTLVDHVMADSTQSSGVQRLARWRTTFDRVTCSNVLLHVLAHDAAQPEFKSVAAWERYYSKRMSLIPSYFDGDTGFMWSEFCSAQMPGTKYWRGVEDGISRHEQTTKRHSAELRLLALELALRLHSLDHGKPPGSLSELVPRYLARLPADPFSTSGFIYRVAGTNWLAYSIGPDGKDDDGAPIPWPITGSPPKGDIVFTNRPPSR